MGETEEELEERVINYFKMSIAFADDGEQEYANIRLGSAYAILDIIEKLQKENKELKDRYEKLSKNYDIIVNK